MKTPPENILFVSDLDGTLLREDGTLSEYSRRTLTELVRAGLSFTVASARTWSEITPLLKGVPLRLPVIAVNGAFLTEFATGRPLRMNHLPADLAGLIYEEIREVGLLPFVCGYDGQADKLYYRDLINEQMRWFHGILSIHSRHRLCRVDDLQGVLDQQVVSFAVMGPSEQVSRLARRLEDGYPGRLECFHFQNPYTPGHWWLTIHDAAACKSRALRELAEMYGYDMKNVVVFGDQINDIRMFQTAGRAVAVANADDRLKPHADEIIASNEEDAVIRYIQQTAGCVR